MPVAGDGRVRVLVVSLCLAGVIAGAQEPTAGSNQREPSLVLKATTRLVGVSVIVQHKGKPVTGLKADDFTVTDNGKPQKIAVFSMETSGALPADGKKLPPNTFTNRVERSGTPASITIVLLDVVNTRREDQIYAKSDFIRFLKTVRPEDHIGVYVLAGGLRILHDYTTDASDLVAKVASLQGINLPQMGGPKNGMEGDSLMLDAMLRGSGMPGAQRDFWTENRVKSTLFALEFIANHLAQLPGRKNLIWISGGFPLDIGFDNMAAWRNPSRLQETFSREVDQCVRALNNANLAIYPVDARGLLTDPKLNAEQPRPLRKGMRSPPSRPVGARNQETMRELADRTGGRAYYNRNDLDKAIREAIEDSSVSYTLGYYPADEQFDGKFHKLNVKVDRGGLNVRFRKGYFDLPRQPQDEKERRTALREAVYSPLDATELGLTVSVEPGDLLVNPNQYRVEARVDASGIGLQREQDLWNGKLDILFVQKDDRGNEYNGESNALELRLHPDTYQRMLQTGFTFRENFERNPKATQLRFLVRDAASGSIGSVTVRFSDLVRR